MSEARRTLEAVWRRESARIVGALARYTRDFALAEDVAQEALAEALVGWETAGIPRDPTAWLLSVGRRRAIDAFRRRATADARYELLARDLDESSPGADELFDPEAIDDDVLALLFISCHPVLSRDVRICLTLRVVGGLTTDEIAAALLVPVATVQARITRAKKTLADEAIPFDVPDRDDRLQRRNSVLNVIYLIFTAGSTAVAGDEWMRTDLASEALRLARSLTRLDPAPEAWGLLALLELTAARFPARLDAAGHPVLLADQDRRRWDRSAIRRGRAALARGTTGSTLGPYAAQAAIAECHAVAESVETTDWARIVELYDALAAATPSPIIDLNRAVAVAMLSGPAAGLEIVEGIAASGALDRSHLLPAVRAEMLSRLGREAEASADYRRAADLCSNAAERAVLLAKAG